jgi:hypothetical protein
VHRDDIPSRQERFTIGKPELGHRYNAPQYHLGRNPNIRAGREVVLIDKINKEMIGTRPTRFEIIWEGSSAHRNASLKTVLPRLKSSVATIKSGQILLSKVKPVVIWMSPRKLSVLACDRLLLRVCKLQQHTQARYYKPVQIQREKHDECPYHNTFVHLSHDGLAECMSKLCIS